MVRQPMFLHAAGSGRPFAIVENDDFSASVGRVFRDNYRRWDDLKTQVDYTIATSSHAIKPYADGLCRLAVAPHLELKFQVDAAAGQVYYRELN